MQSKKFHFHPALLRTGRAKPERYAILRAHQAILERQQQQLASHWALLEQKLALYREQLQKLG